MATFTVTQSGNWSDPTTWGNTPVTGEYPGKTTDDDVVNINTGNYTVTYDIDNSSSGTNHRIASITVGGGETLEFDTTQSTHLWIGNGTSDCINLDNDGTLTIGSSASPLASSLTCTIEFDQSSDGSGRGIDGTNGAQIQMYGATKTIKAYTTAALTANTDTTITFSSVPSDWAVGDQLLIQNTTNDRNAEDDEVVTVDSLTTSTVTFSDGAGTGGAVANSHASGAMVLNLTRNIRVIATDTSSRVKDGIYASNIDQGYLSYVEFNGCSNGDRGGAWNISTQAGTGRAVRIEGCVSYNMGNDGAAAPGSGTMVHKDCIIADATGQGFDTQNDNGMIYFENCYFVRCGSYGAKNSRGQMIIVNCQGWSNSRAFFNEGEMRIYGGYLFGNNDVAIESPGQLWCVGVTFGESEAATQANFNATKTKDGQPGYFHDCVFASGEDFQTEQNTAVTAYSSNHNQTASNLEVDYGSSSSQSIVDDTTTFRTSSPSIQMNPGVVGNHCLYEIPLQVESGSSYTISMYGKKTTASPWRDPYATVLGCGLNDTDTWSTADTNWNQLTLTGTATRDGIAIIYVVAFEDTFNLDDITVS